MNKLLRTRMKDYQRGCVYYILAVIIAVPLTCVLVFLPVYFATRSGVSSSQSLLIMVIPMSLYLLILFGGGAGAMFYFIRRRSRWLYDAFTPLGLEGRSLAVTGRQFHGTVSGRQIDVHYYRGPVLNIYIQTDVKTRVSFTSSDDIIPSLAGVFNKEAFRLEDTLDELYVIAHEEQWARQLANQPGVTGLVRELVFDDTNFLYQQVYLNPGALSFRLYRTDRMFDFKVEPDQVNRWIDTLIRLADIVEKMPDPAERLEESELEKRSRSGTLNIKGFIILLIVIVIVAPICLIIGISAVMILMNGGI